MWEKEYKIWREDGESRGKGTGYTTEVTAEFLASLEALWGGCVCVFERRPRGSPLLDLIRHVQEALMSWQDVITFSLGYPVDYHHGTHCDGEMG